MDSNRQLWTAIDTVDVRSVSYCYIKPALPLLVSINEVNLWTFIYVYMPISEIDSASFVASASL